MYFERDGGNEKDCTAPCPGRSQSPVTRVAVARGHPDTCSVGLCAQHEVLQPCIIWFVQRHTGSVSLSLLVFLATPYKSQREGMLKSPNCFSN